MRQVLSKLKIATQGFPFQEWNKSKKKMDIIVQTICLRINNRLNNNNNKSSKQVRDT